jgi:hypothetical protein
MSSDNGSELINKFIDVLGKKIQERKFRWDFLKGFSGNCKKVLSSLAEEDYPDLDIFRPLNVAPNPIPDPCSIDVHIMGDKKYNPPFPGGGV